VSTVVNRRVQRFRKLYEMGMPKKNSLLEGFQGSRK